MFSDPSRLAVDRRAADLERMATEQFDIVVIGGGVTGSGVALDAALRGLSVALIEQRDYASGTSSRSSKLFHGGLRYLQHFEFGLVTEALRERNLMLDVLCPHLARPVPFLYPLTRRGWERVYVGAGVALYDLLATVGHSRLPRHRHLSKRRALEVAPGLDPDRLVGAVRYWDAQVDDARHTMTLARTAAFHGAALAPSTRAVGFDREGGWVRAVRALDLESGRTIVVRAKRVINATGVWTDRVEDLAAGGSLTVRASKGVHLVVERGRIESSAGIITKAGGSVLFIIPWGEHWIIGTTDTDWDLGLAHPAASRADIDYLLAEANRILHEPLSPRDVKGVYAGLRPLLQGESDATSQLSREHAVAFAAPGLVSVAGGKYTTYRVMAKDAVELAVQQLDVEVPDSTTDRVPLVGAAGYASLLGRVEALADRYRLAPERVERMLRRYGDRLPQVLEPVAAEPGLVRPVEGAEHHLAAEIRYAVSHEGALHLDDVLTRRTRISIETWDRGVAAAEPAARLMGSVLGWSETVVQREVEHYLARVAAERHSQEQADDWTADAARLGAPDVRGFSG